MSSLTSENPSTIPPETPDPSIRESSVPAGNHDDHEATPTPDTIVNGVKNEENKSDLNRLNLEQGGTVEISGEEVKNIIPDSESGDKEVKVGPDQSDAVIPDVTVVIETPPEAVSSAELSQTSHEGVREGEKEAGRREVTEEFAMVGEEGLNQNSEVKSHPTSDLSQGSTPPVTTTTQPPNNTGQYNPDICYYES